MQFDEINDKKKLNSSIKWFIYKKKMQVGPFIPVIELIPPFIYYMYFSVYKDTLQNVTHDDTRLMWREVYVLQLRKFFNKGKMSNNPTEGESLNENLFCK